MGLIKQLTDDSVFQQLRTSISISSPFSDKKKSIRSEEDLCKKIRKYKSDSSIRSEEDLCKKIRKYKSDSLIRSEDHLCKNIRKFKSDSCLARESNSFSKRLSLALEEIESFEQDFVAKTETR